MNLSGNLEKPFYIESFVISLSWVPRLISTNSGIRYFLYLTNAYCITLGILFIFFLSNLTYYFFSPWKYYC